MGISNVSGYLHAYEAYRIPKEKKDNKEEKQGELVLTEKSREQMMEDRQNYSAMLHIKELTQQARQSQDKVKEEAENQAKVMTIFRRISKGDIVPQLDEKKLMEYDQKLYMAAKQSQAMARMKKRKKHDSLWKDEEKQNQPIEDSVDRNEQMKEFIDAQSKAIVEVPAPETETSGLGSGLSGAAFDASI